METPKRIKPPNLRRLQAGMEQLNTSNTISDGGKRLIGRIMAASADPNAGSLQKTIAQMPEARQQLMAGIVRSLQQQRTATITRARDALMDIPADEWAALVDEANAD